MKAAYALGRILLPVIFIVSGIQKLLNIRGVAKMLSDAGVPVPDEIAAYLGGMPKYEALAYLVGGVELIAALMILIGLKARWGAVALIGFTIVATVLFHNFWAMTGAAAEENQIQALKNLSIIGGLLLVVAGGSGGNSMDGRPRA
jgi:putative oxidoreductase